MDVESMEDMEHEGGIAFSLLQDKALPFGTGDVLLAAACCPTMDLIALASKGKLVVQRSIKWERLFAVQSHVTCMAWRPDGKALCAGHEDGTLSLFDVESGDQLPLPYSTHPHSTHISSMYWTGSLPSDVYATLDREEATETDLDEGGPQGPLYVDRALRCLLPPAPVTSISKPGSSVESSHVNRASLSVASNLIGCKVFGEEHGGSVKQSLQVLVTGDKSGIVTLSAFGYFPIGCIDLSDAFKEEKSGLNDQLLVTKVCLSADLNYLVAVLRHECDQKTEAGLSHCINYRVATVRTSLINIKAQELRHVAALCGHVGEHISRANEVTQAMAKQWMDGIAPLQKQLDPLVHQLACFDRPNTAEEELFMMLACGVTSNALQQYFAGVTEASFQRLGRMLDNACANVESLIINSLMRVAESLVFRLTDMLGLARYEERFGDIGLEVQYVEELKRAAELLVLKTQETLIWVQDARANFAAFTMWLQGIVRKQAIQEELSHGCSQERYQTLRHRQSLIPAPDTDRLIKLLGPAHRKNGKKKAPLRTESAQLLQKHVAEQFEAKGLSSRARDNWFTAQEEKVKEESWHNIAHDVASFERLSLKQVVDMLQKRWKPAYHKPSRSVSSTFKPVDNIPLFSFRSKNKTDLSPDISMRQLDIHFRSNVVHKDLFERQLFLSFVLNGPQQEAIGVKDMATPTIWIMRRSTQIEPTEWHLGCIQMEEGTKVNDIAFYGEAPGGHRSDKQQNDRHLIVSANKAGQRIVATAEYMDIAFQSMKQSPILRNKSEGSGSVFVWDPRMMPAAYVKPMAEVLQKSRSLAQSAWHSSNLCVSGTRGVACIFTDNGRFQLFDMEEDEDEEEDENVNEEDNEEMKG